MLDPWDLQDPPRLVGYESWLCQMPRIDSSGDVFVSVPLPKNEDSDRHELTIANAGCIPPLIAAELARDITRG